MKNEVKELVSNKSEREIRKLLKDYELVATNYKNNSNYKNLLKYELYHVKQQIKPKLLTVHEANDEVLLSIKIQELVFNTYEPTNDFDDDLIWHLYSYYLNLACYNNQKQIKNASLN